MLIDLRDRFWMRSKQGNEHPRSWIDENTSNLTTFVHCLVMALSIIILAIRVIWILVVAGLLLQ
jgi:hypothetical protein